MTTKAKKTTKIIVDIVLWVFLAFAVIVTIMAFLANASGLGYPKLGDRIFLSVGSNSMDGPDGFRQGDLIVSYVISDEEKANLHENDVITYFIDLDGDGTKELNTHRIIEVKTIGGQTYYQTKGDNPVTNPTQDNYLVTVSAVQAVWKGEKVVGLGSFVSFIQGSTGFLICIVLPMAAIFIYQLIVLIKVIVEMKGKGKKTISAQEEEEIKKRAIEEFLAKQKAENDEK